MRNIFSAVLLVAISVLVFSPSTVFAAKKLEAYQTPSEVIILKEHVQSVDFFKEKNGKIDRRESVTLYDESKGVYSTFEKWTTITIEGDMQFTDISYTEWCSDWPKIHFEYVIIDGVEKTKKGKPFYRVISLSDSEAAEMEGKMKKKKSSGWSLFAGF